ncbi:MAG: potassium channel family protein [Gemmatimonadota bacterium]|nr:potassium channel family protein [Gemmatimonadota bacterium]
MVRELLFSGLLLAMSVLIHATVLTQLFRRSSRWPALASIGFFSSTWQMIKIAWWIILAHLAEVVVWGCFYGWKGIFPDYTTAAYFSIVTYTTVGYGDVLVGEEWRLLAGVEALTGLLMCGWSAGFFFSMVNQRAVGQTGEPRRQG